MSPCHFHQHWQNKAHSTWMLTMTQLHFRNMKYQLLPPYSSTSQQHFACENHIETVLASQGTIYVYLFPVLWSTDTWTVIRKAFPKPGSIIIHYLRICTIPQENFTKHYPKNFYLWWFMTYSELQTENRIIFGLWIILFSTEFLLW